MLFLIQEEQLMLDNASKIVLYYYASWMPFHKKMLTMLHKMEEKYEDMLFFAVDADYFKALCRRFAIESVPTILILKDGKEAKRINGLVMTSALKSAFADICKKDADLSLETRNGKEN